MSLNQSGLMTAGVDRPRLGARWTTLTAVMMIASMATLMRSYIAIKLFFLVLFVLAFIGNVIFRKTRILVYPRLVWFYLLIALAGLIWAFVGVLHPNNYVQGDLQALRLYVLWSFAFIVLYTFVRTGTSLRAMHEAIIIAGILIPLINFVGLYDQLTGLGLISDNIRQELGMDNIGFGIGYIQYGSSNIISMFVIAPYLLSLQFRADARKWNSMLTKVALVLSLIFAALSGRRALWIVVVLTPCTILLLSRVTGGYGLMKARGKKFLIACTIAGVIGLGMFLIFPQIGRDLGTANRLQEAFSSEDERTIEEPYLIGAFMKSPVLGSGFGGYAGYQRNEEEPWTYELTYQKLLFNMGIVGTAFLVTLFSAYLLFVVKLLRRFKDGSAIPFALLVGFCSLLIGAYSNPYFSGFDTLFFAGLLPYLSTFRRGFDYSTPKAVVSPL